MQLTSKQETPVFSFLRGGGEMGERTRNFDWSQTVLGTPDQWPQSLRTSVSLLLNSQFPMFVWWGKELTTIYNDAYKIIAGDKHPALLGKSGRDAWPEIWNEISSLVEKVFNGGATWAEDLLLHINRRGFIEEAYFTFSYSPILDETGAVGGLFCAVVETTEKVMSKKKSEESERRFRNMVNQASVAIMLTRGTDVVIESINKPMLQFLGKKEERDVLGKKMVEVSPELEGQPGLAIVKNVAVTGESFSAYEVPVSLLIEGKMTERFFDLSYTALKEENSETGVLHVAMDVTPQVLGRKKIEESERNLRNTILQAPVAMCILKGRNYIVEVANERIIEMWGAQGKDVLGKALFDEVLEVKGQGFEDSLYHVYTTGETYKAFGVPFNLLRNGNMETAYIDFVYEAYKEDDGSISGVIAVAIDVTEQVIARKKIERAEEKVRLAVASAGLGTYEINLATDEISTGDRFNQIWGVDHSLTRAEFAAALHPDDHQARAAANEQAVQHGDLNYEARVIRKDSTQRWVRVAGKTKYDDNGQPATLIGVVQDITEEKLFAAQLSKQVRERTAALETINKELQRSNANLEEFAHAASHDLKEPIRKIHFFTDRLKHQLETRITAEEKLTFTRIESASQRMSALIDDLLLYSHVSQRPHEKEVVDLNEKVKKAMEDLELEIQQKNAVITFADLPVVKGYRRQLQQLFQNLIGNALKYSKPGMAPKIEITSKVVNGLQVGDEMKYDLIEVKDNGIGFEQENADRIFQMFQRLHSNTEYRGTGVGLSIAKKVAENHNGKIWAESEPGNGATFKVYLPIL